MRVGFKGTVVSRVGKINFKELIPPFASEDSGNRI
jgi:hypothetical protein